MCEGGDAWFDAVKRGTLKPKYIHGWHIDAMADHLQALAMGQIKRLLINVPPDSAKSAVVCVLWPDWIWAREPSRKFLFSSYSESFTKRDSRKARLLLQSDWYSALFPGVRLADTPDTQLEYHTTAGGERHGAAPGSGVTGKHVDLICEDDPIKAQDATGSPASRDDAWQFHTEVLSSRLLPHGLGRAMVMQRLHHDDPAGRILRSQAKRADAAKRALEGMGEDPNEWVHLCLPMEFESKRRCMTRLPFIDPRKEDGELLWPERVPRDRVEQLKSPSELGAAGWAAQGQQRPGSEEDTKVRKSWWLRYREMPERFELVLSSWDMKLKKGGKSWVSGQVWGRASATRVYKLYAVRFRGDILKTLEEFLAVVDLFDGTKPSPWPGLNWPKATGHLVEDAANGPAVMGLLQTRIPGLIPVGTGNASKEARLAAVTPFIEAKNCLLPEDDLAPWKGTSPDEFMQEVQDFPNGGADDQVDGCSQALMRMFEVGKRASRPVGRMDLSAGIRQNPWDPMAEG